MALSDDEQRMLNLIAERMHQDDPKLATSLASSNRADLNRKKLTVAVLIFLFGIIVLVGAVPVGSGANTASCASARRALLVMSRAISGCG